MQENIALIREVHHNLPREEAEAEAVAMLQKLSLESIANKRQGTCSNVEIFCVMLIRAMMSDAKSISIYYPFSILDEFIDAKELLHYIATLGSDKDIMIVDTVVHKGYYNTISDQKVRIDEL